MSSSAAHTTKTFGKSTRTIPAASEKAQKWYPAEDEAKPRTAYRAWTPRNSLQPGTVLILLAGRFRGKRVVLLKNLEQGVLLVTGPFKINGVPLRRVNSRYVIATSLKVDVSGVSTEKLNEVSAPKYFTAEKASQKAIDKALLASIKKVDMLASYLQSSFSLRKGDKPHEMKF
ncbi:translation protein SH3-like domain-containing protein [Podospora appendiculata]|uniref:60S ribosomal protein L6 n=1 Tax=Podospora appendiculata TaxID=314037 RepID=A0AAE0XI43_9PEZI|nr:translation protein SH3-like domain-containing protein [Podospora appendiculata]